MLLVCTSESAFADVAVLLCGRNVHFFLKEAEIRAADF
jgi:hypothetical protein